MQKPRRVLLAALAGLCAVFSAIQVADYRERREQKNRVVLAEDPNTFQQESIETVQFAAAAKPYRNDRTGTPDSGRRGDQEIRRRPAYS